MGADAVQQCKAWQSAKKADAGLAAITLAEAVRWARGVADPPGDLSAGGRQLRSAARPVRDRSRHVHPGDDGYAPGRSNSICYVRPALRGEEVSGASCSPSPPARSGPGGLALAGGARRRRLGDQRPEDLDIERALSDLRHHRRCVPDPNLPKHEGPDVLLPRHEIAEDRDSPDPPDVRIIAFQRGVLHRRARAGCAATGGGGAGDGKSRSPR